jgi:hypothetical protein
MLVTTKTVQDHVSKHFPGAGFKLNLNRLEPTRSRNHKIHGCNHNPTVFLDLIQLKIIHNSTQPQFGVITIELGKIHFRQFTGTRTTRNRILTMKTRIRLRNSRHFRGWGRGRKFARTRHRGMHQGRDRPIAILPVAVVEAVPTGLIGLVRSRWAPGR